MRRWVLLVCTAGTLASSLQAAIYGGDVGVVIPDGNPAGWMTTVEVTGESPVITDVRVELNVSGGFNGDLYAYLSHGGVLLPLLNRVGVKSGDAFGYGNTGFEVTLSSSDIARKGNVHSYQTGSPTYNGSGQLTGIWEPDGRKISPLSDPGTLDSTPQLSFSAFNGISPNGNWTLFFADLSAGGQSQLDSWSLTILSEVPEPVNVALGIFGGVALVVMLARTHWLRAHLHQWRMAIVHWIDAV